MKKKINDNDILRLVYENFKRKLNEDNDAAVKSVEPIDFHPSMYKGKYYFNVTIYDKSLFGELSRFPRMMAGKAMKASAKRNIPFSEDDFKRIRSMYKVTSSNNEVNDQTEYMILKVSVDKPEKLLDEKGEPNWESQDIKKIWNVLTTLSKMGLNAPKEEIQNAFNTMFHYVANRPSKENEAQVEVETQKLFFKICQTLGEDETRQLLRTIQITEEGFIADHQYSLRNKLRIIAQAIMYDQNGGNQVGTISYLATPRQWRKMGRQVIDFSYPYHTVTFNGGRSGQQNEIEFAKNKGLAPITMNENQKNNIGFATGKGLNAAVNAEMNGRKSFSYNDAVYDVQATEVINGAIDKFTTEPGMKNNLTGDLNDVALQKIGGSTDITNKEERDDRTNRLNNIFNTNDYANIDLTYQATCMAAHTKPNLPDDASNEAKIKETGSLIDRMIIQKLSGFKNGEGHIALPKNYLPLVSVGRIIIQAIIGLPMDDAPAIAWTQEHEQAANILSTHVHSISNNILRAKSSLKTNNNGNLNEALEIFSPLLIFEETFNKTLNLIKENAEV